MAYKDIEKKRKAWKKASKRYYQRKKIRKELNNKMSKDRFLINLLKEKEDEEKSIHKS